MYDFQMEIALFLIPPMKIVNSKSRKKEKKVKKNFGWKGQNPPKSDRNPALPLQKNGAADWLEGLNGGEERRCFGAVGRLGVVSYRFLRDSFGFSLRPERKNHFAPINR